jgi:hypothetical protein
LRAAFGAAGSHEKNGTPFQSVPFFIRRVVMRAAASHDISTNASPQRLEPIEAARVQHVGSIERAAVSDH